MEVKERQTKSGRWGGRGQATEAFVYFLLETALPF